MARRARDVVEPRAIAPHHAARLEVLRRWSTLLDSAFKVPGTRFRFGWDPLLGVLPGIGDAVSGLFSCLLIVQAAQIGIPRIVQARMLFNVLLDALLGAVPVIGDLFDVAWKANTRNLRLLEQHAYLIRAPTLGDWAFVGGILAVVALTLILPVVALIWALRAIGATWL